ncbi:hypothetical protein BGP_3218 [Beggiatoa sp. PS]|nr:hypothetical protein BGP_3218 [Beggiatoa sp. PS]
MNIPKNIPIGSMIQRRLDGFYFLYKHVGIYIGDKDEEFKEVIHFFGTSKKDKTAEIKNSTIEDFRKGKKVTIRQEPKNTIHGKAVCDEAKRICRDPDNKFNNKYDFVFENCEDFAVHCYEVEY